MIRVMSYINPVVGGCYFGLFQIVLKLLKFWWFRMNLFMHGITQAEKILFQLTYFVKQNNETLEVEKFS